MYCKSCGTQFASDEAVVCLTCGVKKGEGSNFCNNCGNPTEAGAGVCLNCGSALVAPVSGEAKSKMVAGLLGILLGQFGVHNFYLGHTQRAVIQLCITLGGYILGTCGSFIIIGAILFVAPFGVAIWGLIEGIQILTGSVTTDAKGIPLKD